MMRGKIALIMVLCVIFCLVGCRQRDPVTIPGTTLSSDTVPQSSTPENTQPTQTHPGPEMTLPPEPVLEPDFSAMPEMYADVAEVYLSGHVAVFAFITAGMDEAWTSVVTYDLREDAQLGRLELGEDTVSIFPLEEGAFAVLSHIDRTFRTFDKTCKLLSETELAGIDSEIGIAGLHGNTLLISQLETGTVTLYDLAAHTAMDTGLAPNVYSYTGAYGDNFLIESYSDGLIRISTDGSWEVLFANGSAQVAGATYAAGIRGDYITMLPLRGGDPFMVASCLAGEMFLAANGVGLLSHSQSSDFTDIFHYYETDTMTFSAVPAGGQVLAAALQDQCAVAVIRTDYSQPLDFIYLNFGIFNRESITGAAYDSGILNGRDPLPDPVGSSDTVALIQRLQQTYGVRIVYEPGVFDLEPLGFTLEAADEAKAYERALLLEQFFAFLPDGLLKEMSETSPVVIYLCQDVHPTAGGLHTSLGGYNVVFLSVTGNDDYFLNVAAHEMAHALEMGMDAGDVAGWRELMPEEVRGAYENPWLTVEYTPDDKGRTPVWFLEAYSRTSEMEDRAVLFAALFDAWREQDYSRFAYDGLRQKAAYWAQLLRFSYDSCRDTVFPWETALELQPTV